MPRATFVYVTYIAAPPEHVWRVLLDGEFTRQYWGHENVSDWKPGSRWEHRRHDAEGIVALVGMHRKISRGWPRVLSSLKSLLGTGARSIPGWSAEPSAGLALDRSGAGGTYSTYARGIDLLNAV